MTFATPSTQTPWRLILSMEALSGLTNQFMEILLPWYVLHTTNSVLWTGVVGFCLLLPNIFSSLFGAPVIDKIGRSKTMLACEVSQFLLIAAIAALVFDGYNAPSLIGLLIFLCSFFDAPGQLARTALIPSFSRYAAVPLSKTTGLSQALDGMTTVIGPILGGLVIAAYGLFSAWASCALFCFIIVNLCLFVYSNRRARSLRKQVTYCDVSSFLRTDRSLCKALIFTIPTFILGQSWELILLPTYIYEHGFSSVYLGLLGAAFGLGAFIGALCFAKRAQKFSFSTLLSLNYLGYFISVWVLFFNLPKVWVLTGTLLSGIPFGAFGAMITSFILLKTPSELRSKTLGLFAAATYTVESCSIVAIAACITWCGLQRTLFIINCIFAVLVLVSICAHKQTDFWQILPSETKKSFTN